MTVDATTLDGLLKNWYDGKNRLATVLYKDFPFLDWMPKNPNGTGKKNVFPIIFGGDEGVAATLAQAQTLAATSSGGSVKNDDWVCSWGTYESSLQITSKVMAMSNGNDGAFVDAQKVAVDAHLAKWSQVLTTYLLRNKGRSLGTFTESSGVCTLTNPAEIVNFSKGMQVVASANPGTTSTDALIGSPSIGYVIAVNPNAGTFTVSATDGGAAGTPTSWTGTMYAFRCAADFGGTSTPNVVLDGYGDWCPATDPTATAFNGVDRTQNITALSGVRLTATEIAGLGLSARIKRLIHKMGLLTDYPDAIFTDPMTWLACAEEYEANGQKGYIGSTSSANGQWGYSTITFMSPKGPIPLYSERFMPFGAIYALRKDAFKLTSLGKCPKFVNSDGLQMLRMATANTYELRLEAFPCTEAIPAFLGRTTAP